MPTHQLDDREISYLSHFEELRTRLLTSLAAIMAGLVVGWLLYPFAYDAICGPVVEAVRAGKGQVMTLQIAESFFTRLKMAGALGLILASPVVCGQLWAFVRPALTPRERRIAGPIVPAVSVLFLAGAGLAHLMMPKIISFFLSYAPQGVTPNLALQESINFPLKIMLAFGIGFQLPVVLIALVALRVLTPAMLLHQWRVAIFVIVVLAAVITPTGDPLSLALLALPMIGLYFLTVLLAYRLDRRAPGEVQG